MYIIFNSGNTVTGSCDFEPNIEDLSSRGEFCVECEDVLNPFAVVLGKYNTVFEPAPNAKTESQLLAEQTEQMLQYRKNKLNQTDWLVTRHLEQSMLKVTQTLSTSEFDDLLTYRQGLRDMPLHPDFPNCGIPEFLI